MNNNHNPVDKVELFFDSTPRHCIHSQIDVKTFHCNHLKKIFGRISVLFEITWIEVVFPC